MKEIVNAVLKHSYDNKLTHVPSALSMLTYIYSIFKNRAVVPGQTKIVLGKPFGSQAYYVVWRELGLIDSIDNLSMGVKHNEVDFVDYSEETMGNALGVAAGIAMAHPDQLVWVNLTDATLQMGSTLEAIQYIGHNQLNNIFVTVDYNNRQVTGKTSEVLSVKPVLELFWNYKWDMTETNGHALDGITDSTCWLARNLPPRPLVHIYRTVKGYGVPYMEEDPVKWHYRAMPEEVVL